MTFIPGIGDTGPLAGPLVLGYMLGCILVGILTMQVYSYYNNFPNDRAWIKWLVGILFGLEMIFTLFTLINAWASFGPGWGDVTSLQFYHWSLVPLPLLSGIIASIVQYFFAYRIYKLTNRMWLPIIIATISALQCVMIFYVGVINDLRGRSFVAFYQLSTFVSIWLAGDAVCDILIAISTVTIVSAARFLIRAARESHFRDTETTLRRLVRLTVETGLITASGATVELILWQAEKFLNYHYIFFLVLGKLYSNALMAALNSRSHINPDTSNANMDTRNHLTLFEDEYLDTANAMGQSTRVAVRHSVSIRHDPAHEMVFVSTKHKYGTDAVAKTSDSQIGADYI